MTEAEWLTCTDPDLMVAFVGSKLTCRKGRLFGSACCRRLWSWLDLDSQIAVAMTEDSADALLENQSDESAHLTAREGWETAHRVAIAEGFDETHPSIRGA